VEQCLEFQKPLTVNFIDFKKAFHSMNRASLWRILRVYGIPLAFIEIFRNLHEESSCCVKIDSGVTDFFQLLTGVRQGCLLSPLLFLLVMDYTMRKAMYKAEFGISWSTDKRLTDLDFADDIALLVESKSVLQDMRTSLGVHASAVGLKISSQKTKVMQFGGKETNTQLTTSTEPIENVSKLFLPRQHLHFRRGRGG
jgi:hypothetical protein